MKTAAILLAACLGPVWAQDPPSKLTHEALKELLSRPRTVNISIGNSRLVGFYTQDGMARLDWGSGGAKGKWRINGDQFCTQYPGIRRGYENCFNLRKTGPDKYTLFELDGSFGSNWHVQP